MNVINNKDVLFNSESELSEEERSIGYRILVNKNKLHNLNNSSNKT